MRPSRTLYLVKVDGITVCTAPNRKLAEKMIKRIAKFEEWNRRSKIMHECDWCITLENFTRIDIHETQMYQSYKGFLKAMGLETIPQDNINQIQF